MNSTAEKRKFKVDDNVIFHLIKSQSDSVDKAIIELIQNSYDAKSTFCNITINEKGFVCEDDGIGFNSKKEIEDFFETFGKSHETDDSNRFGRFRMGRGQIMALTKTNWLSSEFLMKVDIKKNGLNYELLENNDYLKKGTKIEGFWYKPLENDGWYSIEYIIRAIKCASKYIHPMKITLNEEVISLNLKECTFENEDFYYLEDRYRLSVYNLGIFVNNFPLKRSLNHIKGTIVTKKHLTLNTSRNEVLKSCKVWSRILVDIKKHKPLPKKKKLLTLNESSSIIDNLFNGIISFNEVYKLKIFKNYNSNKGYSIDDLSKYNIDFTFDITSLNPNENIYADRIVQKGIAIVLSSDIFYEYNLGYENPIEHFFKLLRKYLAENNGPLKYYNIPDRLKKYSDLENMVNTDNKNIINDSDLNKEELCAIRAFRYSVNYCIKNICWGKKHEIENLWKAMKRKIYVGDSIDCYGWTDGDTYIVLNRKLINKMINGIPGSDEVASVWLHEVCHTKGKTDIHDIEFYKRFHNLVSVKSLTKKTHGTIGYLAYNANKFFAYHLNKQNCKIPKSVSKSIKVQ